ncbi:MAG: hypothetical protein QGE95_09190 [Arenicellales bacterium]|nr:hypothetical protein [Arenicellales bacterium]
MKQLPLRSRLRPCRLALMWSVSPILNDGKRMPQQVTGPPIYYRVHALLWSWVHAGRAHQTYSPWIICT